MHRPCPHTCCRRRTGPGCEPRSRASGGLGAAWGSSASVCPDALPWGLGLGLITIFPPQSGRRGPRAPAPSSQSSAGLWRSLSRAFPGFSSRWRQVAGRRGSAHPGPGGGPGTGVLVSAGEGAHVSEALPRRPRRPRSSACHSDAVRCVWITGNCLTERVEKPRGRNSFSFLREWRSSS